MTVKNKIITFLVGALVLFGAGFGAGYHVASPSIGPAAHKATSGHIVTIFTPYDDGIGNDLAFLDEAHKSVHIAGYSFTDPRITDKLVQLAKERHVKLYVLLDLSQTQGRSGQYEQKAIDQLRAVGAEIVIGTSEQKHEIMHDKFTVVDEEAVEDGSWNYTKAANFQDNVLNFDHDPVRAGLFLKTWHRMHDFMVTQGH